MFIREEKDPKNTEKDSEKDDDSTEEEDSSEDDNEEQDDSDSEDEEDITKQYFTDPKSLDPKLRGAFKKMQGKFTRRMQEATSAISKATALDRLLVDPEFQEFMKARNEGRKYTSKSREEEVEEEDDDSDEPITHKTLKAFKSEIIQALKTNRTEEKNEDRRLAALREEAAEFKKKYPDWEMYSSEIGERMANDPTLSYEDTYKLASYEDMREERKQKRLKEKKNASTRRPSPTGAKGNSDGKDKSKKMTIVDAWNLTKKQLGI